MHEHLIYKVLKLIIKLSQYKDNMLSQSWIDCYESYTVGDIIDRVTIYINDYVNYFTHEKTILYYHPDNNITEDGMRNNIITGYEILMDLEREIEK